MKSLSIFAHKMKMMVRKEGIHFVLLLIFLHIIGGIFIYTTWEEWWMQQKLAWIGVGTKAIVQACLPTTDDICDLVYQYELSLSPDQQVQSYLGKEAIYCNGCRVSGEQVTIKYSLNDPSQVRLKDPNITSVYDEEVKILILLCGVWLIKFIGAWLETIQKRGYIHVWFKILSRIVVGLIKKWIIEPLARWLDYLARKLGG